MNFSLEVSFSLLSSYQFYVASFSFLNKKNSNICQMQITTVQDLDYSSRKQNAESLNNRFIILQEFIFLTSKQISKVLKYPLKIPPKVAAPQAGTVAQGFRPLLGGVHILSQSAWDGAPPLLLLQLPANGYPGRQQMMLKYWVSAIHMGDPHGIPALGFYMPLCRLLQAFVGMNQRMKGRDLFLSVILSNNN